MRTGANTTHAWICVLMSSLGSLTACEQAHDNHVAALEAALKQDRGAKTSGDRGARVDDEDRQAQRDLDQRRRRGLQPLLSCVEDLGGQQFVAHWGYGNVNKKAVRRKLGRRNGFDPAPSNRGQPTLFEPGTLADVFSTSFSASTTLIWSLDGARAVADVNAKRCAPGSGAAGIGPIAGSGSAGWGSVAGSGGPPPVDPCTLCESVPHDGNTNCPDSRALCDGMTGNSSPNSPIMPEAAKALLCHEAVKCIHASGCASAAGAQSGSVSDCVCGPGVEPNDCFINRTFEQATGVCKLQLAAAAESTKMADVMTRLFDTTYASGAASQLIETCDQFFCAAQCLPRKNPCAQCESIWHGDNTNCTDSTGLCDDMVGNSSTDSPILPGTPRPALCRAALDCIHNTGCSGQNANVTDCLCGAGTDPRTCFMGTFEQAAGACRREIAAAAESTKMSDLQSRLFDTVYASGAANAMVATCDQFFCAAECLGTPAR